MATTSAKVSIYGSGVRNLGRRLRQLSSTAYPAQAPYVNVGIAKSDIPDSAKEHERQFPLPGGITTTVHRINITATPLELQTTSPRSMASSQVMSHRLNSQQQIEALKQFGRMSRKDDTPVTITESRENVECRAVDAPQLLKNEFKDLFPNRNLNKGPCTIITLQRHTEHDMAAWSTEMEEERELLTEKFIRTASEVCDMLKQKGYWADFIDPSSGRPYLGAFTNSTLFETDDRYRKMGVRVEDLGCCKVVSHQKWGSKTFVATLFTNAPVNCEDMTELLGEISK